MGKKRMDDESDNVGVPLNIPAWPGWFSEESFMDVLYRGMVQYAMCTVQQAILLWSAAYAEDSMSAEEYEVWNEHIPSTLKWIDGWRNSLEYWLAEALLANPQWRDYEAFDLFTGMMQDADNYMAEIIFRLGN